MMFQKLISYPRYKRVFIMLRFLFLIVCGILIFPGQLHAQPDSLLQMLHAPFLDSCKKVAHNSQLAIGQLKLNEIEKMRKILEVWKYNCHASEPIFRLNLLLDLYENKNIDSVFSNYEWHGPFKRYSTKMWAKEHGMDIDYEKEKAYYGFVPFDSGFDSLTKRIAKKILTKPEINTTTRMIGYYYSNQFKKYERLYHKKHNLIKASVRHKHANQHLNFTSHFPLITNTSFYFGALSKKLDFSQTLALRMGFPVNNKWRFDLDVRILYFNFKESIAFEDESEIIQINSKFGIGMGGALTRYLYRSENKRFNLHAGTSLNILTVSTFETKEESEQKDGILGLISESGLYAHWRLKNYKHLGVFLKHHYLNLNLNKAVQDNYTGHGLSIGLIYGLSD